MRYYLDFCRKYHLKQGTDTSLAAFLKKLDEKNQPVQLRKQAEQAVRLYFALAQFLKKQQDLKNTDNTAQPTKISPNTYSENIQEYRIPGTVHQFTGCQRLTFYALYLLCLRQIMIKENHWSVRVPACSENIP